GTSTTGASRWSISSARTGRPRESSATSAAGAAGAAWAAGDLLDPGRGLLVPARLLHAPRRRRVPRPGGGLPGLQRGDLVRAGRVASVGRARGSGRRGCRGRGCSRRGRRGGSRARRRRGRGGGASVQVEALDLREHVRVVEE